jgi:uncharacterized protein YbaR (Trm112 family)
MKPHYSLLNFLVTLTFLACSSQGDSGSISQETVPPQLQREFSTDFSKRSLSFAEIFTGGPPKDGIPALLDPPFISVSSAQESLTPKDPVIVVKQGKNSMILPLRILTWHEIVNTGLDGIPLAVTYCPLCNTSLVFDRRHQGQVLDFGTTGSLHGSNLLMYDRQTESWWQQATGEAVLGRYTGDRLKAVPSLFLSWSTASTAFPEAQVLSEETGHERNYGENPYPGYDSPGNTPFLYQGDLRDGADPVSRVMILGEEELVRVPYAAVFGNNILSLVVEDEPLILIADKSTGSPLDTGLFENAKINGTVNAYSARVEDFVLTFEWNQNEIRDQETGSLWDVSGTALEGPLAGKKLKAVNARQSLDFSAYHFYQEAVDF